MRVGLVRNVGLSAVALLALGLAGCDDNPLKFEDGAAVMITTNPSVMIIPAGLTTLLESRVVDQGSRPTFDEITPSIDATCGGAAVTVVVAESFVPVVQAPGVFDVTGGNTIGNTCITLTGGGMTASVEVTVVGDSLEILGALDMIDVLTTLQLTTALLADDGTPVSPFNTATDIAWTSDDGDVASVDAASGLVTGNGAGTATITATWSNAGVSVTASVAITVVVPIPVLTSTDVVTADASTGTVVTITGTGFLIGPHAIFVDGVAVIAFMSPTIVDGVTATFQMPPGPNVDVDVQVGSVIGGLSNILVVARTGETEPANESPGTAPSLGAPPIDLWGTVDGSDPDDFFEFTLAAPATLDLFMEWVGGSGDLDLLIDDAGLPFNFPCGFATATGAVPESGTCALGAGTFLFWVDSYDGGDAVYHATATIAP